jgi:O-antigen ligase
MDMQAGEITRNGSLTPWAAGRSDLRAVKASGIWGYLKTQDILFWLVDIYLFLEYVRPQTLYPVLDVLPYTKIVILLTTFLLVIDKREPFVRNIENRLLLLFFVVIVLSSTFAMSPGLSFEMLPDFIAWMLIYFIIVNIVNTEKRFLVFMLAFLLYNFKMAQFAFRGWAGIGFSFGKDGTGGGPGWFQNSGEFGIEMCIFLPLAFYFFLSLKDHWPRWKQAFFFLLPVLALLGMVASSSRGAVLGGLAVLVWMLVKSKRRLVAAVAIGLVAFFIYAALPVEQVARFEQAGADSTSLNRTERWQRGINMAEMYPILGVGYRNWSVADQRLFNGTGVFSHNVFIECMSELGYSGLAVFVLMILFTLVNNHRTRKILRSRNRESGFLYAMAHGLDGALIGFLASGFFVTVLYYPYFWINLAMTVALNNIARKDAFIES